MADGITSTPISTGPVPARLRLLTPFRVAVAFVLANVALLFGSTVPHQNEYVYLLRLQALADPSFLRGDWTYRGPFHEHFLFNAVFAPLTRVAPIEIIGWVGRITCWVLLTVLALALAQEIGARTWPAAVALVGWMACQSRIVGADWVFGTFEAKPIAYVFLFAALLAALRARPIVALAAAGLAFSLHPGVGIWSAPPLVLAMAFDPVLARPVRRWWWVAVVAALPGVWGIASGIGGTSATRDVWAFIVDRAMPFHLDPLYFGVGPLVALWLMFAFNVWCCRRGSSTRVLQLLARFQVLLAPPMVAGMAAYALGADEYLKYLPFRMFPVLTTLLFAFLLARAWPWSGSVAEAQRDHHVRTFGVVAAAALALTVAFGNPVKEYAFAVRENYRDWTGSETRLQRTFRWISYSTPRSAVFILPPSAADSFYRARRPQVANLKAISYEDVTGWHDRVTALLGSTRHHNVLLPDDASLEAGYDRLSVEAVENLRRRYGADYLVSRGRYSFPVVHREGRYSVYELGGK